ncbi:unnamed protein product [Amoebophrya sp. A120]|nr:unnamed protein product [Amoebophrya sp. A120]|eukprot:GSA120T00003068001.1
MKLLQFRTLWGVTDECDGPAARSPVHTMEETIPLLAQLGFDGIEIPFKLLLFHGVERMTKLLVENNMKCNVMIFTDNVVCPGAGILWGGPYEGYTAPPTEPKGGVLDMDGREGDAFADMHFDVWKEQVNKASFWKHRFGLPLHLIVSHSGRDFFTARMAEQFFRCALAFEVYAGEVPICHETHRSRILYSPWRTIEILKNFPSLKLCADFSHWVCVSESMDGNVSKAIEFCSKNVYHTHCRVGHEQGSQVPDPRADEWLGHVEQHETWWNKIWQLQKARGDKITSMIAEHGPPPYQICQPGGAKEPLAKIWEVNHWIHLRRQRKFLEMFGSENASHVKELPSFAENVLAVLAMRDKKIAGTSVQNDVLMN